MRIAHIAPPWLPLPPKDYGGTENVLFDLIEEQVAQGHKVTLFAPGDARTSAKLVSFFSRSLRAQGVPWAAHLKSDFHMHRALAAVAKMKVDIVHTHLSTVHDLGLFPLLASFPLPHLTTLHSNFPFDHVGNWTGNADECYVKTWGSSIHLVTISEQARRNVEHLMPVMGVVHNGISLQRYRQRRARLGKSLLWIGRFVPEKGAHTAIEVAKRTGHPLILGGLVDRAVPEAVRYFEESIKPQVDGEQIQFIGPVRTARKIKLLAEALGFLNPIDWEEPFGMVMIEAMALGCPVISFARGAAAELIVDGETGFLVDSLDEMVQAVDKLDSLDRAAIRQHVEAHFSAGAMARNYEQMYQRVREMKPSSHK